MNHFKNLIFGFLFVASGIAYGTGVAMTATTIAPSPSSEQITNHVVQLTPGQSFTIGDTQVMCTAGNGGNCSEPPMETKVCVRKDSFNRCTVYDSTYSVPRGASCTAECVKFDNWDACAVRNICLYRQNCCFIKKECVEFDSWDACSEWRERVICN